VDLGRLDSVFLFGLLIYSTDPDMYYLNLPFLLKMGFLVLRSLFTMRFSAIGLVERPFREE